MPELFDSFNPPTVVKKLFLLTQGVPNEIAVGEKAIVILHLNNSTGGAGTITVLNSAGEPYYTNQPLVSNGVYPWMQYPFFYMDGLYLTPSIAGIWCQCQAYDWPLGA